MRHKGTEAQRHKVKKWFNRNAYVLLPIVILLAMLLGAWIADTVQVNIREALSEEMRRTRAALELTPARVIIIAPEFADLIHFEPRETDLDLSGIDWSGVDHG
jgi:hypothetical protein